MIPNRKFSGIIKHPKPQPTESNTKVLNTETCDTKVNPQGSTKVENSDIKQVSNPIVKVSFLILSHNRDITGTLKSIVDINIPFNYEILINDDSKQYTERDFKKFNLPIRFFNHRSEDISDVYKSLLIQSRGKYLYYLEDDDFILPPFIKAIRTMDENDIDLMYCNYVGYKNLSLEFTDTKILDTPEFIEFCGSYNHYDLFQLGRFIFKKSICKVFPKGNNVLNDWFLFSHLQPKTFAISGYVIYKQNVNGDNISFEIKPPFYKNEEALMVDFSLPTISI